MTKKNKATIARIRRVKLTPADKLDRMIDELHEPREVEEEANEKICEYAVDLQHGMEVSFRRLIEEIQEDARLPIPEDRKFEMAETSLSLLVASVCFAERMLASAKRRLKA